MRTTPEENREAAKFIAEKLNHSVAPLRVLLPEKGVSALDAEGQAFYNPEATGALFEELEKSIQQTPERKVSHFFTNFGAIFREVKHCATGRMKFG